MSPPPPADAAPRTDAKPEAPKTANEAYDRFHSRTSSLTSLEEMRRNPASDAAVQPMEIVGFLNSDAKVPEADKKKYDVNHDGKVSQFERMDTDGNGRISDSELTAAKTKTETDLKAATDATAKHDLASQAFMLEQLSGKFNEWSNRDQGNRNDGLTLEEASRGIARSGITDVGVSQGRVDISTGEATMQYGYAGTVRVKTDGASDAKGEVGLKEVWTHDNNCAPQDRDRHFVKRDGKWYRDRGDGKPPEEVPCDFKLNVNNGSLVTEHRGGGRQVYEVAGDTIYDTIYRPDNTATTLMTNNNRTSQMVETYKGPKGDPYQVFYDHDPQHPERWNASKWRPGDWNAAGNGNPENGQQNLTDFDSAKYGPKPKDSRSNCHLGYDGVERYQETEEDGTVNEYTRGPSDTAPKKKTISGPAKPKEPAANARTDDPNLPANRAKYEHDEAAQVEAILFRLSSEGPANGVQGVTVNGNDRSITVPDYFSQKAKEEILSTLNKNKRIRVEVSGNRLTVHDPFNVSDLK